jgi:hypothetical protein
MGKCFCGAVHYAVPDEFLYAMNCHCSNCRRATGSAFKPFGGIERDKLSITQGRDGLLVHGDENRNDNHCKACGSLLYSVVRDASSSTSPWELSSTIRLSAPPDTSSSAPRHRGSQSPTTCPNMRHYPVENRDAKGAQWSESNTLGTRAEALMLSEISGLRETAKQVIHPCYRTPSTLHASCCGQSQ